MRAAAVILLIVSGVAHADALRTSAIGFNHYVHDRDLFAGGKDPVPCARCHLEVKGLLVGKPDHAACFGSCHGPRPIAPKRGAKISEPDRFPLCTNCHAEAALVAPYTGKLAAFYPPYNIDPDFRNTIGHHQHRDVACTQCHAEPGRKQPPLPHARCAGCHDGAAGRGPPMSKCSGCHPAASGSPEPTQLRAVHDTVTATFAHGKHAARGGAGAACATCHAAIATSDDTQLPRPTVKDCARCHDGVHAFPTTNSCTRCHAQPQERFNVARPQARFVHGGVHDVAMKQPCASCHPVSPRGDTLVAGHASCSRCHEADFGERNPKICGACHNATEPWRHLVADRASPQVTEFGATLDHGKHLGPCAACHTLRTETEQLRPPRGHAACTTKGCHAITGGPAPLIGACDGCHRLGLAAERMNKRVTAPWSVRSKFEHAVHRQAACTACHVDMQGASVVELASPPKASCAPCHDGNTSFKLTGTRCGRCHLGAPL